MVVDCFEIVERIGCFFVLTPSTTFLDITFTSSTQRSMLSLVLTLLSSYTSLYDRSISNSPNIELSSQETCFFEFQLPNKNTIGQTILYSQLTLHSNLFDGTISPNSNIRSAIHLTPVESPHGSSPRSINTTAIFQMKPSTYKWSTEITSTIAPRLSTSALDPTQATIPSSISFSHIILPRGMKEDGKDFLRLRLDWLDANNQASFIQLHTQRHPDRNKWPTLEIQTTNEYYSDMQPTVIPQNTATDLTITGTFEPMHWYSCCFASTKNSSSTTALQNVIYKGPFNQARSTTELNCESPPVNDTAKHCTTFETVGTFGRCYETLRLIVIRRWRKEGEEKDREVILGFQGDPRDVDVVITTSAPQLREPNNFGTYENNAPFFNGASGSNNGQTFHGADLESNHDNPSNLGSVL